MGSGFLTRMQPLAQFCDQAISIIERPRLGRSAAQSRKIFAGPPSGQPAGAKRADRRRAIRRERWARAVVPRAMGSLESTSVVQRGDEATIHRPLADVLTL